MRIGGRSPHQRNIFAATETVKALKKGCSVLVVDKNHVSILNDVSILQKLTAECLGRLHFSTGITIRCEASDIKKWIY